MMSKDKLFNRLKLLPNDFKFKELENILQSYWFKKIKTNTWSHMKWKNENKNITYMAPRKNPMKIIYLKQSLEILNLYFN